ncbi:type VI secretion system baseplate subunit TssG, partial [bacterium]
MSEITTTEPGIAERLFREGHMFDFFQAVRLLELFLSGGKSPGETSDLKDERIRFRPHHGLAFPAADVRSIERLSGNPERARITATFMGLYGVDSPLPGWFHEPIAMEADHAQPLREFLDLFNNRLYALFYRSWAKYRLFQCYSRPSGRRDLLLRVLSLSGLGTQGSTDDAEIRAVHLAAFAGMLSLRVRNAEGLCNMLAELLEGIPVTVLENVPRWVVIPKRNQLGRTNKQPFVLSITSSLGQRVNDISGKFRIVLGALTLEQYVSLLPGGDRTKTVNYVVRLYVRDPLDYDVQLKLKTSEIPQLRLGDRALKLGLTTWL